MRKIFTMLIVVLTVFLFGIVAAFAAQNQMQATILSTQTSSPAVLVAGTSTNIIADNQFATVPEVQPLTKIPVIAVAPVVSINTNIKPALQKMEGTAIATAIVAMPAELTIITSADIIMAIYSS